MADDIVLRTEGLGRTFGSLKAVDSVSLSVPRKQTRAIIGPNGAGKSTLMDLISKRTKPSSGKIWFDGKEITNLAPNEIATLGLGKCFQISKLFYKLSALENIQIALIHHNHNTYNMKGNAKTLYCDEAQEILRKIGIADKGNITASSLSYGDQRRLEIGITLAIEPKLLMLDEPTAGVARQEGYKLMQLVRDIAEEQGLTTLFIEHDMDIVFNYAEEISVMSHGQLIASGTPQEIRNDPFVRESYLGGQG